MAEICRFCGKDISDNEPKASTPVRGEIWYFHSDHYKQWLEQDSCRICKMVFAGFGPKKTIEVSGGSWNIHPDCERTQLRQALLAFKKAGLGVDSRQFRAFGTAQQSVQFIVDRLITSTPETDIVQVLTPIWSLARINLLFTPSVPEPIAQALEPKPEPEMTPESPRFRVIGIMPEPPVEAYFQPEFKTQELIETRKVLPQLRADMLAIAQRPIRIIWDPNEVTASTDCLCDVWMNPYFFETGQTELGFGIGYHEAGHPRFSVHVRNAMKIARQTGGEVLAQIVNLIVDRHDDEKNSRTSPGFADTLRQRLTDLFPGHRGLDPWYDFAYACKKRTRPRFKETAKAMKAVKELIRSGKWETRGIVEAAQKVRNILREHIPDEEVERREGNFCRFMAQVQTIERGPNLTPAQRLELEQATCSLIKTERRSEIVRLRQLLQAPRQGRDLGLQTAPYDRTLGKPEVQKVNGTSMAEYQRHKSLIQTHLAKMLALLSRIDSPVEETLRYQEEGELDLENLARLLIGLPDVYTDTIVVTDLDAEIHMVLDLSGSMIGEKVAQAKLLGVLFNEGILSKKPYIDGQIWGYHSLDSGPIIYHYGSVKTPSPVVQAKADGGNADYELLRHIAPVVMGSKRRKKLIIMIGDDGPSNPREVNKLSTQLMGAGIPVVHIMVGVHAAPRIFPIELLFWDFEELIRDFGALLANIIRWI